MGCDLETRDPQTLARLFDLDEHEGFQWSAEELGDVLIHQLNAPLLFDLTNMGRGSPVHMLESHAPAGDQPASFGELFAHPHPPEALLQLVKEFAKMSDTRENRSLPSEVSTVLYYAAILAARLRLGQKISTLSDDKLHEGIQWALAQPWLGPVRQLFEQGNRTLRPEP